MNIRKRISHLFTFASLVLILSCGSDIKEVKVITDIDGNTYETVRIGGQVWIAGNLNVSRFRNGDAIPEVRKDSEWENVGKEGKPAWSYYNNDPINGEKYGKLYNWYAVNDPRGLCPEGWHVPAIDEWNTLVKYFGSSSDVASKLNSAEIGWLGLQGGRRWFNGSFFYIGFHGIWWSSTVTIPKYSQGFYLGRNTARVSDRNNSYNNGEGFSVRCLRDEIFIE